MDPLWMLEAENGRASSLILGRQAFVAALPLLLYGLCVAAIAVFLLSIGGPSQIVNLAQGPVWHYGALVVGLLALTALVAAAAIALFGYLPAWSYTWVGAAMMGFLIAINLVLDDRNFALSPVVDCTLVVLFCLSALVAFGRAASRGWPHSGLFSVGVAAALGLSLCFFAVAGPFLAYLGGLAALVGAIEAALVYAYVRGSNAARLACLAGVGIANVGIAWLVEWAFRSAHPTRGVGQFWSLAAVVTALLVGGTLAGGLVSLFRRLSAASSSQSLSPSSDIRSALLGLVQQRRARSGRHRLLWAPDDLDASREPTVRSLGRPRAHMDGPRG